MCGALSVLPLPPSSHPRLLSTSCSLGTLRSRDLLQHLPRIPQDPLNLHDPELGSPRHAPAGRRGCGGSSLKRAERSPGAWLGSSPQPAALAPAGGDWHPAPGHQLQSFPLSSFRRPPPAPLYRRALHLFSFTLHLRQRRGHPVPINNQFVHSYFRRNLQDARASSGKRQCLVFPPNCPQPRPDGPTLAIH